MAYAINIRSDNATAAPLKSLWAEVSAFEESSSMQALGYPPHVTLAAFDDDIDVDLLRELAITERS
jgi:hypothetical protein